MSPSRITSVLDLRSNLGKLLHVLGIPIEDAVSGRIVQA
jgi:hypothetical protein